MIFTEQKKKATYLETKTEHLLDLLAESHFASVGRELALSRRHRSTVAKDVLSTLRQIVRELHCEIVAEIVCDDAT